VVQGNGGASEERERLAAGVAPGRYQILALYDQLVHVDPHR
jgi:hypothetical protein